MPYKVSSIPLPESLLKKRLLRSHSSGDLSSQDLPSLEAMALPVSPTEDILEAILAAANLNTLKHSMAVPEESPIASTNPKKPETEVEKSEFRNN